MREMRYWNYPALVSIACFLSLMTLSSTASAQFTTDTPTQSEVLNLSNVAKSIQLAEVVRRTSQNRKCSSPRVSLEKTFADGVGGWLVQCEEGQDYWVTIPVEAKKAAIALPCIVARATAQVDCYANFRSVLPEHAQQCMKSQFPDRVISACTAIIQSGRLNEQREALSTIYQARGAAFSQYRQFDLALGDFDRAITLSSASADAFYNRAVTLERKGDFDQGIRNLNEALRLKPDHPYANYERGFIFLSQKDYSHAIDDFGQAIRLKSDDAKAYRGRSQAYRIKGELAKADADQQKAIELDPIHGHEQLQVAARAQTSPQPPPAQIKGDLTEADRQAAYCMEASFGYAQQYTRLTSLLRENVKSVEALRERPVLSPADKEQIAAKLKSLNDDIATNEATSKRWHGNTAVFLDYLKRRGLLQGANSSRIAPVSQDVRRDQQAVADTYSACLRLCNPENPSCKNACDNKANTSDASTRMRRCEQIVTSFR